MIVSFDKEPKDKHEDTEQFFKALLFGIRTTALGMSLAFANISPAILYLLLLA